MFCSHKLTRTIQGNDSVIIIKNIHILSMKSKKIEENQSILIRDSVIKAIGRTLPATDAQCTVIDGNGKYVMPGLINMHTHLGDNANDLLLYLVNGITTIRNMWGYERFKIGHYFFGTRVFDHLKLKKDIAAQRREGPDIYTAGPLLDGENPFFPKFMYLYALKNIEQIERVIKHQVDMGYDFIKIYSKLSLENFDDIMEISKKYNISVAGHIPDAVSLEHAIQAKIHSMEHLYGFINPYYPEKNLDAEQISQMANLCAVNEVWNCPTLIANERLANISRQTEFENEDQMDYISSKNKKAMRFLMQEANKVFAKDKNAGPHEYMEHLFFIIRQLKKEGAGILLGTDKSVPYVVAGFSEHKEMQLLSQAGLSNFDVLKSATIDAAKCLDKEKEIGTIEPGKKADLIITKSNPLKDLQTISNHAGVIKSGIYYSREKCDDILDKIKKKMIRS